MQIKAVKRPTKELAKKLTDELHELKEAIQHALVNRIVQDFIDVSTPLKQFSEAVNVPQGTPNRKQNFNQKSNNLQAFSDRASKTIRMVAASGSGGNKKIAEISLSSASQVDSLTPQLVSATKPADFIKTSKDHMQVYVKLCERCYSQQAAPENG